MCSITVIKKFSLRSYQEIYVFNSHIHLWVWKLLSVL
jgi:hypothetical protein